MLPKNEKVFNLNVVGEVTGERYEGDFTCICVPDIRTRNKISRDEIKECGDLENISTELYARSKWLANASNRVFEAPTWWDSSLYGSRLLDDNILKAVYDKCIDAELEWRANVKGKSAEATPATTPA